MSPLYFFPEKPGDLFSRQSCGVTPISSSQKLTTFSCSSLYRFLLLSLGCHPPPFEGVTPHLFYLSDLVSPLFFVNLPTKNLILRVSPPERCRPGRSAPSPRPHLLVTPLTTEAELQRRHRLRDLETRIRILYGFCLATEPR